MSSFRVATPNRLGFQATQGLRYLVSYGPVKDRHAGKFADMYRSERAQLAALLTLLAREYIRIDGREIHATAKGRDVLSTSAYRRWGEL